ncbi:MAG: hypothetical protein ACKOBW_06725 [Planctomycetota bacterium]
MKIRSLVFAVVVAVTGLGAVQAADWGDLTLQFTLDGAAPAAKPLSITKDTEVCSKNKAALVDEKITVNKANGGIANVFVYLRPAADAKVAIHPDFEELAKKAVELDNKGCRFEPHAAVLWTKQELSIKNSDAVGHNTKIDTLNNPAVNPILPANGQLKQKFTKEERLPSTVSCSIHPWMTARVLVRDNPYAAVSDADGKVTIKNLPTGKWDFQIWHEGAGFVAEVKDGKGKAVKWSKGRAEFEIKKGANDYGTYKISLKDLDK